MPPSAYGIYAAAWVVPWHPSCRPICQLPAATPRLPAGIMSIGERSLRKLVRPSAAARQTPPHDSAAPDTLEQQVVVLQGSAELQELVAAGGSPDGLAGALNRLPRAAADGPYIAEVLTASLQALLHTAEDDGFLLMKPGVRFFSMAADARTCGEPPPHAKPSGIMIRECWPRLADTLFECQLTSKLLLQGTSGTGKTKFISYFLRYLLLKDPSVTIVLEDSSRRWLIHDGVVWEGTRNDFMEELRMATAWYITDGVLPCSGAWGRVLMVSSPDRQSHYSYSKDDTQSFFMPVWAWEELLYCYKKLYEQHFPKLTLARVGRLYSLYGGVIRHVLGRPSHQPESQDELEMEYMLKNVDTGKVECALWYDGIPDGCHGLLHLRVDSCFQEDGVQFASEEAKRRFDRKAQREQQHL